MKTLTASALLIALLSLAKSAGASQNYVGTLAADQPYIINVDNGPILGKTAVVVRCLIGGKPGTADKQPRLGTSEKFDVLTVGPGARESFLHGIPKGTRLIVIDVGTPPNATVNVEVVQGLSSFTRACVNGCSIMLDVQ
jgi:hypothetical protein